MPFNANSIWNDGCQPHERGVDGDDDRSRESSQRRRKAAMLSGNPEHDRVGEARQPSQSVPHLEPDGRRNTWTTTNEVKTHMIMRRRRNRRRSCFRAQTGSSSTVTKARKISAGIVTLKAKAGSTARGLGLAGSRTWPPTSRAGRAPPPAQNYQIRSRVMIPSRGEYAPSAGQISVQGA